jgi:hypothetical protein
MQNPSEIGQKTRRTKKKQLHPIFKWLRTAGGAAELFGWGGLMLAGWFWTGVTFIYAGFLLLVVDVWFEPELKRYTGWRVVIGLLLLVFATAFSLRVVFVNAPLDISAFSNSAEYPIGTTIAGISWRPEFSELLVSVRNPSEKNYDDVNLLIRPAFPIAAIAQQTSVPNVSFEDKNGFTMRLMEVTNANVTGVPLILLATDAGYRMRCSHLAAGEIIKVEIALVDIKWNPAPPESYSGRTTQEEKLKDRNYIVRAKFDDFSSYWLGHANGDDYAPRPTSSEWVKVEGQYTASERTRWVSQKLQFGGAVITPR